MRDEHGAIFLSELDSERQQQVTATSGWQERLARAYETGRQGVVDLGLAPEALLRGMARALAASACTADEWLDHLHAEDLALACACSAGLDRAIACFTRRFQADIAGTTKRFARPDLSADDLQQLLLKKLFVAESEDQPPRIAAYTGQGHLQNWLRVTATRTSIDASRVVDTPERPADEELLEKVLAPGANPELELARRESAVHLKAAVGEAVAGLSQGDRLVLKQHMVSRLSIDQIAALYGVHRATAARRVSGAREALVRSARAALMRRMRIGEEQLDSMMALLESRLEVSVARLLEEKSGP